MSCSRTNSNASVESQTCDPSISSLTHSTTELLHSSMNMLFKDFSYINLAQVPILFGETGPSSNFRRDHHNEKNFG